MRLLILERGKVLVSESLDVRGKGSWESRNLSDAVNLTAGDVVGSGSRFSFCQKNFKLSCSGVGINLIVPGGGIEFCKPLSELSQGRRVKSLEGLLQGFHIAHGLSDRFRVKESGGVSG